jgi:glutamate 5-kinase
MPRGGGAAPRQQPLPVGVIRIDGQFARGDAVIVRGPDGAEIGRGLVAYDAGDAEKVRAGRPATS